MAVSPTIMRVKKIPIDRTWAEFWKVVFIPDPAPRSAAGSEFMMPARLGEPKPPIDSPMAKSSSPKAQ